MLNIQLYILDPVDNAYKEVELFADESISLTQTLQDVKDISKIFTDFSKTFNVPASKSNNKVFQHYYNPEIIGVNPNKKYEAKLFLNHQEFRKGKVKMDGVSLRDNKAHTYRVTFFGDTIKLTDLIGDDKLQALDVLQDYSFSYNHDNVKAYLQNGLDITANGEIIADALIVPLITHTNRMYYDSGDSTDATKNVYYVDNANIHGVEHEQLKPALRIHAIVKAIETRYGINFSSEFFNPSNDVYYKLYMWLHRNEGAVFQDDAGQEKLPFNAVGNFTGITLESPKDNDVWNTNGEGNVNYIADNYFVFRQPQNAANVDHFLAININTDCTDYDVVLYRDGYPFNALNGGENVYNRSGLSGNVQLGKTGFKKNIDIGAGNYQFKIRTSQTGKKFDVEFTANECKQTRVGFINVVNNQRVTWHGYYESATDIFNSSVQLPDIKVMDFLTGLFKMFNLTAYIDSKGIINVLPLNDFYANSKNTFDITSYLDTNNGDVTSLIPYKNIDFKFEGTDAFFAANHKAQFGLDWGRELYTSDQRLEGDDYEIEIPFEHHKFERLIDPETDTLTTIQWGWSVDINQQPYLGKPLLFYGHKITSGTALSLVNSSASPKTKSSITDYYVPLNSTDIDPSQTINFSQEYSEYAIIDDFEVFPDTLYTTYYKEYIEDTFDNRRRLFKCKAFLPLRILLNFSLADRVVIYDSVYKVNKITTNFQTGLSDLELINELEVQANVETLDSQADEVSKKYLTVDTTLVTVDNSTTV